MANEIVVNITKYKSPCGLLTLGSMGEKLCLCDWLDETDLIKRLTSKFNQPIIIENHPDALLIKAQHQLDEYFMGTRKSFDIPIYSVGADFQMKVWDELLNIPYGETVLYKYIAAKTGTPNAVRAVANAIGKNLISIFIPCHRVIGSNNRLTGYRGGIAAKQILLDLEHKVPSS